jgi:hypothetical protein
MNDSGKFTHRPRAIDPANFRAQATGVGQSCGASRLTGADRAMEVAEHTRPRQRAAAPAAEGRPMGYAYEGTAEYVALGDADDTTPLMVQRSTLR